MTDTEITVSTGTLLTISTGVYLTDSFEEFHHAAEVVMSQPIFTHQFASRQLSEELAREAQRQHPWLGDPLLMDDFPVLEGKSRDECRRLCEEFVARRTAEHGPTHRLVSAPETRHVPLLEGMPAKFGGAR